MTEEQGPVYDPENGNLLPHEDMSQKRLIASFYCEFLAGAGSHELVPRVLGFVPDNAAEACANILEKVAHSMRQRGRRLVQPVRLVP